MPIDVKALGAELAQVVAAEIAPLTEKIKALQAEIDLLKAAPPAKDGKDGTSVTIDDVKPLIEAAVKALPPAKDGQDGKSLTPDDVRPMLEAMVKAIPPAKDGQDGTSVTIEDVKPLIEAAVKAIPTPSQAMIDREGVLLFTYTNGEVKSIGRVEGRDGSDGKDGISFEDFGFDVVDETNELRIKATAAGRTKEVSIRLPGVTPGGYWRDGTKAQAGEGWTHDGSFWIAKRATVAKPSAQSEDWMLAARKGRDGESVVRQVAGEVKPIKLKG